MNTQCVLNSGVIRRQGSPPHPLSGYIQAQIHSRQMHLAHAPYPPQTTQMPVQAAVQERFPGFQHAHVQAPVVAGNQVHVKIFITTVQAGLPLQTPTYNGQFSLSLKLACFMQTPSQCRQFCMSLWCPY